MDEEQFYGKYYEFLKETENHVTDIIKTAITNEDSTECPVKYISHRIKKPNSVINKLKRKNLEENLETALSEITDIIGHRIVVRFASDIAVVKEKIKNSPDIKIVCEKDYISKSKPNGYRGYHLIIETEINGKPFVSEIQLRTMAMDCWASLEHKIAYKKELKNKEKLQEMLKVCADKMLETDNIMEYIKNIAE